MTTARRMSCIFYDGSPLVLVEHSEFMSRTALLDWYAANYAFERSKLTVTIPLRTVLCEVEP